MSEPDQPEFTGLVDWQLRVRNEAHAAADIEDVRFVGNQQGI